VQVVLSNGMVARAQEDSQLVLRSYKDIKVQTLQNLGTRLAHADFEKKITRHCLYGLACCVNWQQASSILQENAAAVEAESRALRDWLQELLFGSGEDTKVLYSRNEDDHGAPCLCGPPCTQKHRQLRAMPNQHMWMGRAQQRLPALSVADFTLFPLGCACRGCSMLSSVHAVEVHGADISSESSSYHSGGMHADASHSQWRHACRCYAKASRATDSGGIHAVAVQRHREQLTMEANRRLCGIRESVGAMLDAFKQLIEVPQGHEALAVNVISLHPEQGPWDASARTEIRLQKLQHTYTFGHWLAQIQARSTGGETGVIAIAVLA
jgi:hypothetical protein